MTQAAGILADLADLRRNVSGAVHGPDDPHGREEVSGYNLAVQHAQFAVVGARSSRDVAATVQWAAPRGLGVVAHATGHGGRSYRGVVVISTKRLGRCIIDPERRVATVDAGVRWQNVVTAAAEHGLAPLSGSSPGVGVVGYTLGGGVGALARQYGFAADLVRWLEIVTAGGELVRVSPNTDPELYWASLGAPGSFGVITRIQFDLVPVRRLYGGAIYFDATDAAAVLHAFRSWTSDLPDATTSSIALLRASENPGVPPLLRARSAIHLRFAHLGDNETGAEVIAPMRHAGRALIDTVRDMAFTDVTNIFADPTEAAPSYSTGVFLDKLDTETVDTLLAAAGPDRKLPMNVLELRHLGGALGRIPTRPNCVGGRDAAFVLGLVAHMPGSLTHQVPQVCGAVLDSVSAWTSPLAPINYLNHDPDSARPEPSPWAPSDYERLRRIKRERDPQNTFRVGRTVQP
jgi:FAD/FMN-containing dehydrogenase